MRDDPTWRYSATELHPGYWVIDAHGPAGIRLRLTQDGRWGESTRTTQVARFATQEEAETLLAPWRAWEEEVMLADTWEEIDGERPAAGRRASAAMLRAQASRSGQS